MSDEPTARDVEALLSEHAQAVHGPRNGPAWYVICKCKWQDEWPDIEVTVPERTEDWFTNDARYDECHERANTRHRRHQAEVISERYAERIAQAHREGAVEVAERVERALLHTDPVRIGWTSQASKAAFLDGETALANRARAALRGDA